MKSKEKEKEKQIPTPDYTQTELDYIGNLRVKMATARNLREDKHDEFDGQTYTQYCESNRKGARAYIEPKKNKEDTILVSGTIRQKMIALSSLLNNINLEPEVRAFSEDEVEHLEMGNGLENIIYKTETLDNDDEKKLARQYVLLEQGTVFVEELWKTRWVKEKIPKVVFNGTNLKETSWDEKMNKVFDGPERNILLNENVYLGDTTIYDSNNQPFIFTIEQKPYDEARMIYGDWERWKFVQKNNIKYFDLAPTTSAYNNNWTITELVKDHVEIAKYQDKHNNEYAIFINGVLMTPVGLPMPYRWGKGAEYTITQQNLGIISPFFAYGPSIPMMLKVKSQLLDEMLRLAVLKTQQSFQPPHANMTGFTLSSRVFMPGKITNGINPDLLKPLIDTTGVTKSEMAFIQELQKEMEEDTPSTTLSGKSPVGASRQTATQSQNIKHQAEVMTTLVIFAAEQLEKKCGTLRLWNVLENYFEPIKQTVKSVNGIDGIREILINKYRISNTDRFIEGEGMGQSITKVVDNEYPEIDSMEVLKEEEDIKKTTGKPARITYLNKDVVKSGKWMFYITVSQKQKKTSDLSKVLFNEELAVAKQFPNINLDYMAERFAVTWGENPVKMFNKQSETPQTEDGKPPIGENTGAKGSIMPKSMTQAGKPNKPSINTMQNQ